MKKSLVAVLLLGMGVLGGSGQALAAEGCKSFSSELVRNGILNANMATIFTNQCDRKAGDKWYPQCKAYCQSTYTGAALDACNDGCTKAFVAIVAN